LEEEQVSFILGVNFLITFQENKEGDVFEPVRQRLRTSRSRLRMHGADHLLYALLDAITDGEGRQLVARPEEIQGQFGIEVDFDPRVMDMEYVRTVGKTVTEMLQLDRGNAVDTFPIVETLMGWLLPDVARRAIRAPATAAKAELEDELTQYLRIRGGVEPPLPAEGANYAARLQMYAQMEQANPAVYDSMPADQSAILKSRVERMKVQAEQYGVNPQIGREGGRRALEGGGEERTET
jgi:hypothetical protein